MKHALAGLAFASLSLAPIHAQACGGFFCSGAPVDQNAEHIVFAIDDQAGTTDMVVQISYQGADKDFAWLLPVGEVPKNRAVFPNGALGPLDAQTGPTFVFPDDCISPESDSNADDDDERSTSTKDPGVTVLVKETVGPYDVVVLDSDDAAMTYQWLVTNGYRLVPAMQPYIAAYTAQGMKFLALKLTASARVKDIQPFRMTLSGTTPTIPLRMTAVAAEPEMGVVVWILAQQRYEPANADELTVREEELVMLAAKFPLRTNWTSLVARAVDAAGGRGWVVEQAGDDAALVSALQNASASSLDQRAARDALVGLFVGRPYMTRLYTRVSPEEMTYDPTFRKSAKGAVSRAHTLSDAACGEKEPDPCAFGACGQLGLCRIATDKSAVAAGGPAVQIGCACAPGSTARTTFDASGQPTVTCQDQRMSFLNPGDSDLTGGVFADPCVGFDCGTFGHCVAMNLTPTCACDPGYIALGGVDAQGARTTKCVEPHRSIPKNFYNRRPPALALGMTAGRIVDVPAPTSTKADVAISTTYGDPSPQAAAPASPAKKDGCSVDSSTSAAPAAALGVLMLSSWFARRRRRRKGVPS